MKRVSRTARLPFAATEMRALVSAISAYPQFLPWCRHATVLCQESDAQLASLGVAFGPFIKDLITRNSETAEGISVQSLSAPFSALRGQWRFLARPEGGCEVQFELLYAFSSRLAELTLGVAFDKIANTMMDAFIAEARRRHNARNASSGAGATLGRL